MSNRNRPQAQTMVSAMSNCKLPADLISEILANLPVKTLVRFKCVCKPWLSLFADPNFIKSHMVRAALDPQNEALVVHSLSTDYEDVITVFRMDSIETPLTPTTHFPQTFFKMELVGSINGLICLCDRSLGFMIVLWNPATRQCKLIQFPVKERHADKVFVGFGFDSVMNDFRVICIFRIKTVEKYVSRFYVYSCNEEGWREIKPSFPYNMPHMWCVVTVKGNPYWMGFTIGEDDENNVSELCVTFDVQTEVFHFLPLPKYESNSATGACLANLKDSLADLMFSPGPEPNKLIDMYVLDDKSGIWNKIYTVGPIQLDVQRVLHCFKNGEIVIEDGKGKLFLYDPISKAIKDLQIDNARELSYKAFCYAESLVTIKKMDHVEEEEIPAIKPSRRKRDDFLSIGFKLKL